MCAHTHIHSLAHANTHTRLLSMCARCHACIHLLSCAHADTTLLYAQLTHTIACSLKCVQADTFPFSSVCSLANTPSCVHTRLLCVHVGTCRSYTHYHLLSSVRR